MADPATRKAIYADIEALPPHVLGEIIYGTLVTHPRPSPRHASAHSSLTVKLGQGYQYGDGGPGGWVFLSEPELHLDGNVVVPDIAGWKRERLTTHPKTNWIETPPDWLCEILSPLTEVYDKNEKRRIYAHAVIPQIWFLDPRSRVLECFTLVANNWLLTNTFADDDIVSAPPFDAANFNVSHLFPLDEPEKNSE